ncbi:MAG: hypothetical protein KDD03_00800 [Gelidibacter sp.]|nr:hypothetical protein [Gelidibacter sp.]
MEIQDIALLSACLMSSSTFSIWRAFFCLKQTVWITKNF